MEEKKVRISRRDFLTGTGAAIGGLTAGSLIGYTSQAEASTGIGGFPFPAVDLETVTISSTGYTLGQQIKYRALEAYKTMGGCCIGGWYGIAQAMRDYYTQEEGAESANLAIWNEIPDAMFKWGAGGGYSWGTVCGALNGTAFVAQAVAGSSVGGKIIDAVFKYYQETSLPDAANAGDYTTIISGQAALSAWAAVEDGTDTICNSPLCHASVSTWCDANDPWTIGSDQKKKRCARVTADMAYKTAVLLAAWKVNAANLPAALSYSAETADCVDCHQISPTTASQQSSTGFGLQDEQGKMACEVCHENGGQNVAPGCTDAKAGVGNGEL